ncbi:Zinc finger protein MAGPIE [Spatholobus suberectus]|nr:Zinc finger protein MAGPIE [Spatholobus suberectus]
MGARASNASLLRGLGLATTLSSFGKDDGVRISTTTTIQWNGQVKQENHRWWITLGLGFPVGVSPM